MTLQIETTAVPADSEQSTLSLGDSSSVLPPLRWHWAGGCMLLTTILATLSFAPFYQFYLAWFSLVPMFVVIARARSIRAAFFWGWLAGLLFFLLNFSYLLLVTTPGALALPVYLGFYWALASAVIHVGGLLDVTHATPMSVIRKSLGVAAVWAGAEWLRGVIFTGLPWLFIGHTQSPLLALCQIVDVAGVYGVMFLIVLVNALIAVTVLHPGFRRMLIPAYLTTAALLIAVLGYGWFRLSETSPLSIGPAVLVIQSDERDFRNKAALEKQKEAVAFHIEKTADAMKTSRADLIAWSETTMPALNEEVRHELRNSPVGQFSEQVHRALIGLTKLHDAAFLVGGYYVDYAMVAGRRAPTGMRNSAFYYDRAGSQAGRYDKLHLVPFGEFIPGKESFPWVYSLFLWMSPYTEEYSVTAGNPDVLTVFDVTAAATGRTYRFVSPICFDDTDPTLIRRMFRPTSDGHKRADFIVNLTNDGWFRFGEQAQHLQYALFRSIENRVPTARAVNTGISGFIDSCGRVTHSIPVGVIGTKTQAVTLDSRITFYTRFGDLFAYACVAAMGVIAAKGLRRRFAGSARP